MGEVLTIQRGHATQARDSYHPLQHLQPYFVANPELVGSADLPVTEDIRPPTFSPLVDEDVAPDEVAGVVVAGAQEGALQ
jgi:hypothetical protein